MVAFVTVFGLFFFPYLIYHQLVCLFVCFLLFLYTRLVLVFLSLCWSYQRLRPKLGRIHSRGSLPTGARDYLLWT
jgi:hypothetical protein